MPYKHYCSGLMKASKNLDHIQPLVEPETQESSPNSLNDDTPQNQRGGEPSIATKFSEIVNIATDN